MEQIRAQKPVAAFGDVPRAINLPGLVAAWGQAQIGTDGAGLPEPFRTVDDGDVGERDDHSDRRNAHEPSRGGIRLGALEKLTVKDTDLFAQALPDGKQWIGDGAQSRVVGANLSRAAGEQTARSFANQGSPHELLKIVR